MDDLASTTTVVPVVTATTNITPDSVVAAQTDRLGKPWSVSEDLLPFLGT